MNLSFPTLSRGAVLVLALAGGCKKAAPAAHVPEDATVQADAVFEAYLAATGGVEAHQAMNTLHTRSRGTVVAQGTTMDIVTYMERPDRSRSEVALPMLGAILSGHADGIAWEVNPLTGARIKEGAEAVEARRGSRFDQYETYRTSWPERRLVGQVEFAGTDCHQLDVVSYTGRPETLFFAVADGRWMGTRSKALTDMGEIEVETRVDAYASFGGVDMPVRSTLIMGAAEIRTELLAVEVNPADFPDLTPPAEILALVEEAAPASSPEEPAPVSAP